MKKPRYSTAGFAVALLLCGCGKYPAQIKSSWDIFITSSDYYSINISELPPDLYPKLKKFTQVDQIVFYHLKGSTVNDSQLQELAKIPFDRLKDINLTHCSSVSDTGLEALVRIGPLTELALTGTSITDVGLRKLAEKKNLDGVNVVDCKKITASGLRALGSSESLTDVSFSAENLTTDDVISIIREFRHVRDCWIVDRAGSLDKIRIEQEAADKNCKMDITRNGIFDSS
jgi:hypothetical protein